MCVLDILFIRMSSFLCLCQTNVKLLLCQKLLRILEIFHHNMFSPLKVWDCIYTDSPTRSSYRIAYADRGRLIQDNSFFPRSLEIHWLSIINSMVLVFLLIGFVVIILVSLDKLEEIQDLNELVFVSCLFIYIFFSRYYYCDLLFWLLLLMLLLLLDVYWK